MGVRRVRFLPVLGFVLAFQCAAQQPGARCDEVARDLPQFTNDTVTFQGSLESVEVAAGLVIVIMKCLTAEGGAVPGGDFGFVITQYGTASFAAPFNRYMRVTGTVREPSFHRLLPGVEHSGPWLADVRASACPSLPCDAADPAVTTIALSEPIPAGTDAAGIAVDAEGNAWVVASGPTIWRVSPSGDVARLPVDVRAATGIARTARGTLIVTSRVDGRVVEVLDNGETRTVAEGLDGPTGVATDAGGSIYVSECAANAVTVVAPDGTRRRLPVPGWLDCPRGIALGADGRVYVAHGGGLAAIDRNGLSTPHGRLPDGGTIDIASAGALLYATHAGSRAVYSLDTRRTQRIAGTGGPGAEDGFTANARFASPGGIAASQDGRWLYVTDVIDGRVAIRRLGPLTPQ
jgi:sugar lactone lactonase YvrE